MTNHILDSIANTHQLRLHPLSPTPVKPLVEEYERLEKDIQWTEFGHKGKQTGVQFREGEDPFTSAVGKQRRPEREYSLLNPLFKGTLIEGLIEKYSLLRTRLMWVGPYATYSMHRDTSMRIHIPIITNPSCYFLFLDKPPVFMPEGWSYKVDTTEYHTFVNCSDKPRLHLVGCVLN